MSKNIAADAPLVIAGSKYRSRLLVGTGKYKDATEANQAIAASGAEIITVAIRRLAIAEPQTPSLIELFPKNKYTILPNTAGCYDVDSAIRTCELARELLDGNNLVKLEILGNPKTLYPDIPKTLAAAEVLIKKGFDIMVYTNDDPVAAQTLEKIGCAAIMPLAAPIGSGLGICNPYNLQTIIENASAPVLVDAGIGTASDATIAMELGCDGILMNTAIAKARLPILMAAAMKKAVAAGREAFLAGRIPPRPVAVASSPTHGNFV